MKRKCQTGGKVSTTGYLPNSPDRFNPYNIIPSNVLTMDTVPHDVLAIPNKGEPKIMKKNSGLHKFSDAEYVAEIPMKKGGQTRGSIPPQSGYVPNGMMIGGSIPYMLPHELEMYRMQQGGATTADSLALYNNSKQLLDYYRSKKYKEEPTQYNVDGKGTFIKLKDDIRRFNDNTNSREGIATPEKDNDHLPITSYYKNVDKNKFYQREAASSILDTRAPMSLYDKRVIPTAHYNFNNLISGDPLEGDTVNIQGYDPIAVKPVSMLTPQEKALRLQRYGDKSGIDTQKPPYKVNNSTIQTQQPIQTQSNTQQIPSYQMRGNQPVYGPNNGMIGMLNNNQFYPDYNNSSARTGVNNNDSSMVMNPDLMFKYLQQKGLFNPQIQPRFDDGGNVEPGFDDNLQMGGMMYRSYNLPKAQAGIDFGYNNLHPHALNTYDQQGNVTGADGFTGTANPNFIPNQTNFALQASAKKVNHWGPNVEAASMSSGMLGAFANLSDHHNDNWLHNQAIQRSTSDSQFNTYNPTLRHGYIDQNSGMVAPNQQTPTQFANTPAPSYYGSPNVFQMGGMPNFNQQLGVQGSIDKQVESGLTQLPPYIHNMISNASPEQMNDQQDPLQGVSYADSKRGSISVKNNNPGNMEYSSFTKKFGAAPGTPRPDGIQGSYAAFPDIASGLKAQTALLRSSGYSNLTVDRAINRWITGDPDKPGAYSASMISKGFEGKKIKELSDDEIKQLQKGIIKYEDGSLYRKLVSAGALKKGGEYKAGGEYDVDEKELSRLKSLGYQIEVVN